MTSSQVEEVQINLFHKFEAHFPSFEVSLTKFD
jgi:hypothetical protein